MLKNGTYNVTNSIDLKGEIKVNPNEMNFESSKQYSGAFPAHTPVGMAYVPVQMLQSVYEPEYALKQGTIFPDLDKPFLDGREFANRMNNEDTSVKIPNSSNFKADLFSDAKFPTFKDNGLEGGVEKWMTETR